MSRAPRRSRGKRGLIELVVRMEREALTKRGLAGARRVRQERERVRWRAQRKGGGAERARSEPYQSLPPRVLYTWLN